MKSPPARDSVRRVLGDFPILSHKEDRGCEQVKASLCILWIERSRGSGLFKRGDSAGAGAGGA
jgi:hypothetical protein